MFCRLWLHSSKESKFCTKRLCLCKDLLLLFEEKFEEREKVC